MSRWSDSFDKFKSSEPWVNIEKLAENINLRKVPDTILKKELAHFRKLTTLISKFLNALDPEIVPEEIWKEARERVDICWENLNLFEEPDYEEPDYEDINDIDINDIDINDITNANKELVKILSLVRPFILSDTKIAQATSQAFNDYTCRINEEMEQIGSISNNTVEDIKKNKDDAEEYIKKIHEYVVELLGLDDEDDEGGDKEDEKSIKSRINTLYSDFKEQQEEIELFYELLTQGNGDTEAIERIISTAHEQAVNSSEQIEETLTEIEEWVKPLKSFHTKIFGTTDSNDKTVGGLEQELNERKNKIDTFHKEQQEIIKGLFKKIDTLLPAAMSAGLASAYRDLKEEAAKKSRWYTGYFSMSVALLLAAGIIIAWFSLGISNLEQLFYKLFISSPIFTPIIWLCLFVSKRRSEYSRLEQEYAHKEALAKSYDGYKREINELKSEDKLLLTSLLGAAVNSLAFNPSTTLDKKHGDTAPIAGASIDFFKNSRQDGH